MFQEAQGPKISNNTLKESEEMTITEYFNTISRKCNRTD